MIQFLRQSGVKQKASLNSHPLTSTMNPRFLSVFNGLALTVPEEGMSDLFLSSLCVCSCIKVFHPLSDRQLSVTIGK